MAITNGYGSLIGFKTRFFPDAQDTVDDNIIENLINGVSRWIDDYCVRRFFTTTSDETRYFTAEKADILFPDIDIISVTNLYTDDGTRTYGYTWAATDYDLNPWNAALDSLPYTWITLNPTGNYSFPAGTNRGVKIIGKFGYCTLANCPPLVQEACYLQCERLFKRKDAPFGIMGMPGEGELKALGRLDPDVKMMLDTFRRRI